MQLDEAHAVFLGPGEGEQLGGQGRELTVKVSREELDVLEFHAEPGFGPAPHTHDDHVDSFFILEGELEFTLGNETVRAGAGTFVSAPPGVVHGFTNPGPGRARFLNVHAPARGFVDAVRARSWSE
jgi:quercetin dioxygenase-like cupin family protein